MKRNDVRDKLDRETEHDLWMQTLAGEEPDQLDSEMVNEALLLRQLVLEKQDRNAQQYIDLSDAPTSSEIDDFMQRACSDGLVEQREWYKFDLMPSLALAASLLLAVLLIVNIWQYDSYTEFESKSSGQFPTITHADPEKYAQKLKIAIAADLYSWQQTRLPDGAIYIKAHIKIDPLNKLSLTEFGLQLSADGMLNVVVTPHSIDE